MEQTNYTHITQFKIEIDNKVFNSLTDLNIYVAGIMMRAESIIPFHLQPFLLEYAQLNGIIKIGELEPDNPNQLWFNFPDNNKVYDVVAFTVRGGDIMLHYVEASAEIEPEDIDITYEESILKFLSRPRDKDSIKMIKIF